MERPKSTFAALLSFGGLASTCSLIANTATTISAGPGVWASIVKGAKGAQEMVEAAATWTVLSAIGMAIGSGGAALLWLGPLAARRFPRLQRWIPEGGANPSRDGRPPAALSVSEHEKEKWTRVDRFRQQQRSIDVAREGLERSLRELTEHLAAIEESTELGRIAYRAIYAMNMSRRMRGHELLHRRLAKLINDLPENLDTRRSNLAEEMNHIRHNLSELADNMALNGIHGGSELSKSLPETRLLT
jgi:hypothetical protein